MSCEDIEKSYSLNSKYNSKNERKPLNEARLIWDKKVPGTNLEKFKTYIERKHNIRFSDYWEFHSWSTQNYSLFWEDVWIYFQIIHSRTYTQPALKLGDGILEVEFFPGARFNYAENMLRYRDHHIALICINEKGNEEKVTYAHMFEEVEKYAAAFRKHGLKTGDTIACYMYNRKEAVFSMLAAASIGAIFGSVVAHYGPKIASAIIEELKPKFLITVDEFQCLSNHYNMLEKLPAIVKDNTSLEKVIIVQTNKSLFEKNIDEIKNSCFLEKFLESGLTKDGCVPGLVFEQLPFSHPLCICFTSGTTGMPKGIIHAAGSLLPVMRDFSLHINVNRDSVILHKAPIGWNVWNLKIGNLALGATILLYEGLPWAPKAAMSFWEVLSKYNVSFVFMVPTVLDRFEKENVAPAPNINLKHLKVFAVGGSPLKQANVQFVRKIVNNDAFIGALYGATEVLGVFSGFDFNTRAYSCQIQCSALGADCKVLDRKGCSVVGECGEMVLGTPTPALPIGMWNDEDGTRMRQVYLDRYPGYWTQSDEAIIDPLTKGLMVLGRSDNVIKQNSARLSADEIYAAIHDMDEISDCICVGQRDKRGVERAVLFVKLKEGRLFNRSRIQERIAKELPLIFMPNVILPIQDVPYNLNGKRMESLIKKIVNTNQVPESSSIGNPKCLKHYLNIPELVQYIQG